MSHREFSASRSGHMSSALRIPDSLTSALELISSELLRAAGRNPELSAALHSVATIVAESTSPASIARSEKKSGPRTVNAQPRLPVAESNQSRSRRDNESPRNDSRFESRIRSSQPAAGSTKPRYSDVVDDELPLIIDRCRLKAEGARWAVEREERLHDGADFASEVRPEDQTIIEQARALPNCFLWMNQPREDAWSNADDYLLVADCFDTLADCLTTLLTAIEESETDQFSEAIQLVAEAQSAVRCAVEVVESHADSDQQLTYHWLRNRASEDRFYISQFMKISDRADPEQCDEVSQRADDLQTRILKDRETKTRQTQLLGQLESQLDQLNNLPQSTHVTAWNQLLDAFDAAVRSGLNSTGADTVKLLLPYADSFPDVEFSDDFLALLGAIDEQLSDQTEVDSRRLIREPSPTIRRVSELISGRSILLIGGELRATAKSALQSSFDLKEVDWITASNLNSTVEIEPKVAHPDTAMVAVAARWSSIAPEEIAAICDRFGKPVVRISSGYDAESVAAQILAQCGAQLDEPDTQSSVA